MTKVLTPSQKYDLISQYCEIVVDGMDYKSLEQYAHESMTNYFENLILSEIKEEIDNYDEELYDELVDNILSQPDIPLLTLKTDNLPDVSDNEADGVTE